ncbi:hypothetical protein Q3G72_006143 [Acer saccharum]|nr:hypothetical protein Q3G72_006143 [Acer saccharum]
MEIESSSNVSTDERLLFALDYHQLEGVIQFNYKLVIEEKWINLTLNTDNIRLINETLMNERGVGVDEKHFPSRISLQLTPTQQTNIISVSVGKSSDNPPREFEMEKTIEGSFDPPNSFLALKYGWKGGLLVQAFQICSDEPKGLVQGLILERLPPFYPPRRGVIHHRYRASSYRRISYNGNIGFGGDIAPRSFSYAKLEVMTDGFKEEIGSGALGTVYKGTMNKDHSLPEDQVVLEEWVYECFEGSELGRLVGDGEVEPKELERVIKVALCCILDEPSLRPSMKKVLIILEGTVDIPTPPDPTSFISTI